MRTPLCAGCFACGGASKDPRTYTLERQSDGTQLGTVATKRITEEDEEYTDDGYDDFFIVVSVDDGVTYPDPFDIDMQNGSGICGMWDVLENEQGIMPCEYDEFLADPSTLEITGNDGSGEIAILADQ